MIFDKNISDFLICINVSFDFNTFRHVQYFPTSRSMFSGVLQFIYKRFLSIPTHKPEDVDY